MDVQQVSGHHDALNLPGEWDVRRFGVNRFHRARTIRKSARRCHYLVAQASGLPNVAATRRVAEPGRFFLPLAKPEAWRHVRKPEACATDGGYNLRITPRARRTQTRSRLRWNAGAWASSATTSFNSARARSSWFFAM